MKSSGKVQSLQRHTGFEWTEVVPTSPSDRAVVHPVSSPIGSVMIRSLAPRAGRLSVSSTVDRLAHRREKIAEVPKSFIEKSAIITGECWLLRSQTTSNLVQ